MAQQIQVIKGLLQLTGQLAGAVSIGAQSLGGDLVILLPNAAPLQGQVVVVKSVNGSQVILDWAVPDAATGSVTSVAASVPAELTITGSPITTNGTLAFGWATSAAHKFIATPAGGAGPYAGRLIVLSDIDSANAAGATSGQALTWNGSAYVPTTLATAPVLSVFTRTGAVTAQSGDYAAFYDALGAAAAAQAAAQSFATSGDTATLATAEAYVQTKTPVSHFFVTGYNAGTGLFSTGQPAVADLSDAASLALLAGAAFTGAVSVTGASLTLSFGAGNALIVSAGQAHFQGNVWLDGGQLLDSTSSAGTAGQLLSSNGSQAVWTSNYVPNTSTTGISVTDNSATGITITENNAAGAIRIASTAAGVHIGGTRGIFVNQTVSDGVLLWDDTGSNALEVGASIGGINLTTSGAGDIVLVASAVTGTHGNVALNGNLHITSANADVKGTITVTNPATSQTFAFARAYASAPVVVLTPQSDAVGDFLSYWVTSTTTDFTVHVNTTPATSAVFNYHVIG